MRVVSDPVGKAAKNPAAGAVECGGPHTASFVPELFFHTALHLSRRFVCKCDRQNIPRIHLFLTDQPRNPVGQHSCFSGSGSGENEQRPLVMAYSLLLLLVQLL